MTATTTHSTVSFLMLAGLLLAVCATDATEPELGSQAEGSAALLVAAAQPFPVSGSAVFFATTAVVHSEEPTATGIIQRSTAVVRITGDLDGWVLFHPTTVIDLASGTLVNTGTQIFSGTVAGSGPVVLLDDTFRFDVDLSTGETVGEGVFARSGDAPHRGGWFACSWAMVGTGVTPEGDLTSDYSGTCTQRGQLE